MKKRRLKRQSLKVRFRRSLKAFENTLFEEQALKETLGYGTIENINTGLFKRLNYNDLYREGITRKINGVTKRYFGKEAIELQIQSLRQRSSDLVLKDRFINNYIKGMEEVGYKTDIVREINKRLNDLTPIELSVAINENVIPQVYFIYANREEEDKILERFNLLNKENLKEKISIIQSQFSERKEIAKKTYELNKALNK